MKMCVLPFVATDLIKLVLAAAIGPILANALHRNGLA